MKSLLTLILFATSLNTSAQQNVVLFPLKLSYTDVLEKVFNGTYDKETDAIKWKPGVADLFEFNGSLGDGYLYTKLDTSFWYSEPSGDKMLMLIAHTSPLVREEGKMINANNCHACGTTISVIELSKNAENYSVSSVIKKLTTAGTFGEANYKITPVDLGNGYRLIQIDDSYSGMGITSVNTSFYDRGEQVLSMVSAENNKGAYSEAGKGQYSFNTNFTFNNRNQIITAKQSGFRNDEKTGRRMPFNKIKTWKYEGNTLAF